MRGRASEADIPDMGEKILAAVARHKYASSASLAMALLVVQFGVMRLSSSELAVRIVLPSTIALVPLALWSYRRFAGVWMMFVGLVANLCAIVANGGLMPIEHATVVEAIGVERAAEYTPGEWIAGSKDVLVKRGDGQAVALGDSIVIRVGSGGLVVSPGDIVVWAGLLLLAAEGAVAWQRRARGEPHAAGEATSAQATAQGGATS